MPARLREQTLAGVDQNDRKICRRRPRNHIAGVLLMAWRVGDYELPARCCEVAVGNVDGDALLTFGSQAVRQEREVDGSGISSDGRLGNGFKLILVNGAGIVEQAADEGGFTVIHAAGRGEPKKSLRLFLS